MISTEHDIWYKTKDEPREHKRKFKLADRTVIEKKYSAIPLEEMCIDFR